MQEIVPSVLLNNVQFCLSIDESSIYCEITVYLMTAPFCSSKVNPRCTINLFRKWRQNVFNIYMFGIIFVQRKKNNIEVWNMICGFRNQFLIQTKNGQNRFDSPKIRRSIEWMGKKRNIQKMRYKPSEPDTQKSIKNSNKNSLNDRQRCIKPSRWFQELFT